MAGETIPVAGHRPDQVSISTERTAQHGNLYVQVVFLDNETRPDLGQQIVLGHHLPIGIDQGQQYLDGPCPEIQLLTIGQ
jgi:hypothetical protein